ncbi:nitroreductase family deazaflavin-dependent oxidoreductase [Tsukamurella sp. 8F]|uniref:nitroreductase family deazaflavin-dependent oxidoreductase n=1 Tax=unclassified Tsukamurella TaxID=2633480 RepID=UPI0023B97A7F|nr:MULTISPECIES: nitroreductase family deazaflavin-dependent oxidoreductase [unclassified Tsukamurella]MDF0529615.1 nitroreductase family deazaflavin-dependent oxidoreductase [Tsukamurella sp. 8J]MDF0589276.1 nitroreductase family deazaflavin-dependent oxidoreductase [Tsukamurella sp. 8F]
MSAAKQAVLSIGTYQPISAAIRRLVPLDRAVTRYTGGRVHVVPSWLVPNLTLTTVGRRSGSPRSTPLLYVRDGGDYIVVASNFGQERHPGWSYNLDATPDAEILVGTKRIRVRASRVDEADRQRLWPAIVAVWPAFDSYIRWAGDRRIKLYRLTPH